MNYQLLKNRIKKNEGFSIKPYKDILGKPTIGYGHLIKNKERHLFFKKQTKEYLNKVFENDFNTALISFQHHFNTSKKRPKKTKELIIEMIFQIGVEGVLKFKKMIRQIEKNNKHLAALEMMDSLWYSQTPKRVENLIKHFLYR